MTTEIQEEPDSAQALDVAPVHPHWHAFLQMFPGTLQYNTWLPLCLSPHMIWRAFPLLSRNLRNLLSIKSNAVYYQSRAMQCIINQGQFHGSSRAWSHLYRFSSRFCACTNNAQLFAAAISPACSCRFVLAHLFSPILPAVCSRCCVCVHSFVSSDVLRHS